VKFRVGPYLRLFRLWPVLWTYLTFINPVVMGCMINRKAPLWLKFAAGNVFMPIALGIVLTMAMSVVVHRPFMMLLPGARRYYRNAQLTGFALCVALGAGISYLNDATLPWPAIVGAVMASAATAIPWEPYVRWFGSRRLTLVWLSLLPLAAWWGAELHALAQAWPWLFLATGAVVAAICFRLGFDRERLRERALSTSLTSVFFSGNLKKAARQQLAKDNTIGRDWSRATPVEGLATYRAALWHERFGVRRKAVTWKVGSILLLSYGGLAAIGVAVYLNVTGRPFEPRVFIEMLHSLVWVDGWGKPPVVPFIASLLAVLVCMMALTFPRGDRLYPLSRRDLVRLALNMSAVRIAWVYLLLALGIGLLAWGSARALGRPFEFRWTPLFAAPVLLMPVFPLIALVCLRSSRHVISHPGTLEVFGGFGGLALLVLSPLAATFGAMWVPAFVSPLTLLGLGGVTLLSVAFYVSRVKKFYLSGDLVERTAA
jgi:hypothetical protein